MNKEILLLLIGWPLVVLFSLVSNIQDEKRAGHDAALLTSSAFYRQVLYTRSWNASHGGVYVPITDTVKPNKYLKDPKRDLLTQEGVKLTKINPAIMTRQLAQAISDNEEIKIHITSLNPLNPKNAPVDWEIKALKSFEKGKKEYTVDPSSKLPKFRYMAPLKVEKSCLSCHSKQGYKVGDIRGGISVTLPVPKSRAFNLWITHLLIALTGLIIIYILGVKIGTKTKKVIKYAEDLKKQKLKAEQASYAKSQFLANMSHEIRTPMNAIVGMADILLESKLDDEQRMCVKTYSAASDVLINLLNDILDLSKIEAGQVELDMVSFDLDEAVDVVSDIMGQKMNDKGLDFVVDIESNVHKGIIGDAVRLEQILMNLIGNAVKFTSAGEIGLKIKVVSSTKNKEVLLFSVSDTGIGIPEGKLQEIFKEFTQVDTSITKEYGGTGLGLNIAKLLVYMMNGKMWVDSKVGEGSTFSFTIEFEKHYHHPDQKAPQAEDQAPEYNVLEDPLQVLFVDDSHENRQLCALYFKKTAFKVDYAENGVEAVVSCKKRRYDLVLMDMQMPVLDGHSAVEQIRKWEKDQDLPPTIILAQTAYALTGEVNKSIEVGCDAHITKPIKKKNLFFMINTLFKHREVEIAKDTNS